MSSNDPNTPAVDPLAPYELEKTYKYFDLDSFETKTETKKIAITPARDLNQVNEKINILVEKANDPKVTVESLLVGIANDHFRAEALAEAEQSVTSKGGKKSVVFAVIRPFRAMPPFNKETDKDKQTAAILNMVKKNPEMIASIKEASAAAPPEPEGTPESDE